jgi:hypothetical protein
MFVFKNAFLKTFANVAIKAFLSIWQTWSVAKTLISLLYSRYKGAKQPTSSSGRMCDECGGIHRVIILFSSQISWKISDLWLSWPSIISSTWLPTLRPWICLIKCLNQATLFSFVVQPLSLTLMRRWGLKSGY